MFTVGIFTTHFPYIAMVVFYAYFLIFGVDQANNGEIRLADHSVKIEQHVNNFQATTVPAFDFFSLHVTKASEQAVICHLNTQQHWKLSRRHSFYIQEYVEESQFCRPPPFVA